MFDCKWAICLSKVSETTYKSRHIFCQHGLKNSLSDHFQNLNVMLLKSLKYIATIVHSEVKIENT